jgi:hypothetical protein
VLLAQASGRKDLLVYVDKNGKRRRRKPEFAWFNLLREMVDGPTDPAGGDGDDPGASGMDSEMAARVLKAIAGSGDDEGPAE